MKHLLQLFFMLTIFLSPAMYAQLLNAPVTGAIKKEQNFYSAKERFDAYWKNKADAEKKSNERKKDPEDEEKDGEWKQFKRQEAFIAPRVFPSGAPFDPEILIREFKQYKETHLQNNLLDTRAATWSYIGPTNIPSGGGAGRINCIAFHPQNVNIIYVGAACGGLWKSVDGGATWSSNTDLLPALSVSDIAFDPQNPSTMYIATGDKYGYTVGMLGFWGGNYSAGIMKSTDGGATWNTTGFTYSQTDSSIIQRIIVNQSNPGVIVAATNKGVFRTTNSGASWSMILSGFFTDLEANPLNPDRLYAADTAGIYHSYDGGTVWYSNAQNISTWGRTSIAVTAADTSVLYLWCTDASYAGNNFYRSTDGGHTFSLNSSPDTYAGPYGYYDQVLEVSPLDPNTVYTGGLSAAYSNDGGASWNYTWGTMHADNHDIKFLPGSGTTVFSCNDGGVFKSVDGGDNWTDLSAGLNIKQYYRLTCSALDPGLMYAGAQDNGTDRITSSGTTHVYGGDGMDCVVDYTNDNDVYVSYQNGNFYKSVDGGNSFNSFFPSSVESGDWTTPIVIDPCDNQVLYVGYMNVHKSVDGGNTWNPISNFFAGNTLYSLAVAPSNPDYIYAASYGNIYKTTNGGNTWANITQNLPVSDAAITKIAVNPVNPNELCVTFSGYINGNKVFTSTNGGNSWTNISGTLPNIPVNCVVWQNSSLDTKYIGTDFGVFYRDNTMTDWTFYNSGLPNVIIYDLEIQYAVNKLRAATYGRGVWESDLNTPTQFALDAGLVTIAEPSIAVKYCGATVAVSPIVKAKNYGQTSVTSFTLNYSFDGGSSSAYNWTGTLNPGDMVDVNLPATTMPAGTHTFSVTITNPNGLTDNNISNNMRNRTFVVTGTGSQPPLVEGFTSSVQPPSGWTVVANEYAVTRDSVVGGFGNSVGCEKIECNYLYYIPGYIYLPVQDFSNAATLGMDFSVAHAPMYDATLYQDSLAVEISVDCGASYSQVYSKWSSTLATAPLTNNSFVPQSNEWRTESIDLSSFAGLSSVFIRFRANGSASSIYLDDINIHMTPNTSVPGQNTMSNVTVFPNPARDQLTIAGIPANEKTKLEVFNAIGEKVFEGESGKNKLDIRNYKPGTYTVKISCAGGSVTKKFIKQ